MGSQNGGRAREKSRQKRPRKSLRKSLMDTRTHVVRSHEDYCHGRGGSTRQPYPHAVHTPQDLPPHVPLHDYPSCQQSHPLRDPLSSSPTETAQIPPPLPSQSFRHPPQDHRRNPTTPPLPQMDPQHHNIHRRPKRGSSPGRRKGQRGNSDLHRRLRVPRRNRRCSSLEMPRKT